MYALGTKDICSKMCQTKSNTSIYLDNMHKSSNEENNCTSWAQAKGYSAEGHQESDQALTRSQNVPTPNKK